MKIQITRESGAKSEIMDFSGLELDDLKVLLKYFGKLTIEVVE